ncbi:MAG TPA: 3-hydroxyacyl-CoA dehydrogenase NAD-binding domain-containing protein [Vicinamibacterales bacterium]|nr:3-hydroxyacyl-CoA dehydrogenase NAD-binding domain-containing protein [Vicinamibacterales bacterium]
MIRSVVVLGAGTMGAQIAAHFANAGVPSLLLDVTADAARDGLKRARGLKPDPFFTKETATLITTGSFDDLARAADADWIIEAIVEKMDVKRALFAKVDAARQPGTIVSSNTSGLSIATLAEGRGDDFRSHFLGTHFFNPPRYLRLLEIVPTQDTDKAVVDRVSRFADHRLGKGVVVAKDTPNFIANHIGLFGVAQVLEALESGEYTIEEIDAMTGPAVGRPSSATFRTMDIAGIDVLAAIAKYAGVPVPAIVAALVEKGWIGDKAGQGFYKKETTPAGSNILTLDPKTMTYRPRQAAKLPSLETAQAIRGSDPGGGEEDPRERIKALYNASGAKDKVGTFLRSTLGPTLEYTAKVWPQIACSKEDVDRAMKWGFGWELGPFETMDAIGMPGGIQQVPPAASDLQILKSAKDRQKVVKRNAGASLVDLGDGVLCLEFHSKMNAIGGDTVQMMQAGVTEAAANFAALVVGNDAPNFSAGANLMLVLLEAQEGNWDEIDMMVRAFQQSTQALRFADVPVVVAPAGLTLGGGCEILLHGDRAQAAAESYIGQVEVGVGLIPAGGGTKEMLARAVDGLPVSTPNLLPVVQPVFETLGFGTVSTSAEHARHLGFLRDADRVTMNRDRLIADAKAYALERLHEGYQRPQARPDIVVGGESLRAALELGVHLARRGGRISDHDAVVGRALANVLTGGSLPHQTVVSEAYLLELEREAFLTLCGQRATLDRIQHTLKTGKPLRN